MTMAQFYAHGAAAAMSTTSAPFRSVPTPLAQAVPAPSLTVDLQVLLVGLAIAAPILAGLRLRRPGCRALASAQWFAALGVVACLAAIALLLLEVAP